ncbi:Uncharacterized protein APZ42_021241, partial [Daphnia magna]
NWLVYNLVKKNSFSFDVTAGKTNISFYCIFLEIAPKTIYEVLHPTSFTVSTGFYVMERSRFPRAHIYEELKSCDWHRLNGDLTGSQGAHRVV